VIARSKIRNENLGMLFLDQGEAYDRVSHDFMWEVMGALGLPKDFTTWIKMLYKEVTINLLC
jgi:hypothetical protein